MASIYQKLQPTADRLMKKYTQGNGVIIVPGEPTWTPWDPEPGEPKEHSFDYVKAKASMMYQYKNDSRVEETDLLIIASKMEVVPEIGQSVKLNEDEYQIVMVDPATLVDGSPMIYWMALRG